MKTYPKLESFITKLAYCVINEDAFADICAAAGITWGWPKTFAGDAVVEFLELREKVGREKAIAKMRPVLSMIESQVSNLSSLPSEIDLLRIEYRDLAKIQRAIDAANLILREPESYTQVLKHFETAEESAVETLSFDELVCAYGLELAKIREGEGKIIIPKFPNVSRLVGGFNPERITFLLADSGFGKSNFGLNLGFAATRKMAVGYMNLEMGIGDIAKRMAVMLSGKTYGELDSGSIEKNQISAWGQHEIRMSTGKELHVDQIVAWCRAFKRVNPDFGLLVIDYDQKMQVDISRETPEWRAVAQAVKALESLAIQLKIHVILVAQLNREGEISSSHRAVFSAPTVLRFREYQGGPVIENAIKHRHAPGPRGVRVHYDETSCLIREDELSDIFPIKSDAEIRSQEMQFKTSTKKSKLHSHFGGKDE